MTLPKIIAPDFSSMPLTIFELSESQLILPLPDNTFGYSEPAPNKIDLYDDSVVFIGDPADNRQIELISPTWDYIIESSSLIAGRAFLDVLVYTIHPRTGLSTSSIINEQILKKWIYFDIHEYYENEKEILIEYARHDGDSYNEDFNGEGMDLENYFTYPRSTKDLEVYIENGTPKCSFQQGISAQRLRNSLYIPISKNHILEFRLDFDRFVPDLVGTKEETDELTKNYAKEFFSHVHVEYNAELKEELAKYYGG